MPRIQVFLVVLYKLFWGRIFQSLKMLFLMARHLTRQLITINLQNKWIFQNIHKTLPIIQNILAASVTILVCGVFIKIKYKLRFPSVYKLFFFITMKIIMFKVK